MTRNQLAELSQATAEGLLEDLRYGLPPSAFTRAFTVGRSEQLAQLERSLERGPAQALLLRANYGSGKSHLLRVVRETALELGYAVSLVEVSAQQGIRFNRMDLVFGSVCRNMEVPDATQRGIGSLFDHYLTAEDDVLDKTDVELRDDISDFGDWAYSDGLDCPPLFIALRAWAHGDQRPLLRDLVTDWLHHPDNYQSQRKLLYNELVGSMRAEYRDPRPDWQFYSDDLLVFNPSGYRHAWDGLADLDRIARAAGLSGLVLLFDEFEDVIQGLNNRSWQQKAFWNLFEFFRGKRFPGKSYFAVTPDFVEKCKDELLRRGVYDFPYQQFDQLPAFQLQPIGHSDFIDLGVRIRDLHAHAYWWEAADACTADDLTKLSAAVFSTPSPDRVRQAVKLLVEELDDLYELAE